MQGATDYIHSSVGPVSPLSHNADQRRFEAITKKEI